MYEYVRSTCTTFMFDDSNIKSCSVLLYSSSTAACVLTIIKQYDTYVSCKYHGLIGTTACLQICHASNMKRFLSSMVVETAVC